MDFLRSSGKNRHTGDDGAADSKSVDVKARLTQFAKNRQTAEFLQEAGQLSGTDGVICAAQVLVAEADFAACMAEAMSGHYGLMREIGSLATGMPERLSALLSDDEFAQITGEIRARDQGLPSLNMPLAAHLLMRAIDLDPGLGNRPPIERTLKQLLNSADSTVQGNAEFALDLLKRARRSGLVSQGPASLPAPPVHTAPQEFENPSIAENTPRVLRIFVCSTFKDMQGERDELAKNVFPRLRKLCEDRGITWGHVDLRWGITQEQKAEGRVLPICLEEIGRCRPYFLGILGERYGWVEHEIPAAVLSQHPWLKGYRESSVTELEILHGVLNAPAMADHAFFYFRDPSYPAQGEPEKEDRLGKLRNLKKKIGESGLPVRKDYRDPKTFGELVYRDLAEVIENFPPKVSDPLERETADHEFFGSGETRVYVAQKLNFERLEAHAAGDGGPLVLLGAPGAGKTALLANWALDHRRRHPEQLVLLHFIGATAESTDWTAMLRRIMQELRKQLQFELHIPEDPEALRSAFAIALHAATVKTRVVLVLDAVNQLEDRGGALSLAWLPPEIPAGVRLILSTLPGRSLQELNRRGYPTLTLKPLNLADRANLIVKYVRQRGQTLDAVHVDRIASSDHAANPLYLRLVLDELQFVTSPEYLAGRIGHYLEAQGPTELIGKILDRYEADYEDQRPGLVRDATTLLWAARGGLSEAELLDALGSGGEPLPQAYWSPLHLAAGPLLIHRGGLIGFSHDYCLTAIEKRYLPDPSAALGAHQRLARYFQTRELGPRKVDELPWQLAKANLWQTLADTLSNMAFFSAAWNRSEFDVKWYWAEVQKHSGANPLSVYNDLLSHPEKLEAGGRWLAYLLSDAGYLHEAAQLANSLIVQCRRRNDREELQRTLDDASVHLRMIGRLNEAWAVHREAESLAQSLSNLHGRASCLGNGATILIDQDDLDGAMRLLKEQESICGTFQDLAGVGSSLGNQALVLHRKGDVQGAVAIYREEEKIARRMNDAFGLVTTLSNRASALASLHDPVSALRLLEEAEGICRALNARVYLQAVLGSRARALAMLRHFDESLEIALQQERLCQELGHQEGLAQSRSVQEYIAENRGSSVGLRTSTPGVGDRGRAPIRPSSSTQSASEGLVDRGSSPHPSADPNRAMRLNLEYQKARKDWAALPWLKRLTTRKPEPPTGI